MKSKKVLLFLLLVVSTLWIVTAAFPLPEITHYYNFDETSGDLLDQRGSSNGELIEDVGYAFGRGSNFPGILNDAYNFSADSAGNNGGYINFTTPSQICHDFNCSISFWINHTVSAGRTLYWQGNGSTSSPYIQVVTNTGGVRVEIVNDTINTLRINSPITDYNNGLWNHVVVSLNTTDVFLYVNATLTSQSPINTTVAGFTPDVAIEYIGARPGSTVVPADFYQGRMDEFGLWNKTLSASEISGLYNSGSGEAYSERRITLDRLFNDSFVLGARQGFNSTIETANSFVNTTFFMWYPNSTIINQTTKTITGSFNESAFNITDIPLGEFEWNMEVCDSENVCVIAPNNFTVTRGYINNSETFNAAAGDLSNETFKLNITSIPGLKFSGASLVYNGVSYSATEETIGNTTIFSRTITTPAVTSTTVFDFNWNFTLSNGEFGRFTTDSQSQTVSPSQFGLCNATFGTEAVNYTIYDEGDQTTLENNTFQATFTWDLGGTLTKNISVDIENNASYSFCIEPNVTFFTDVDIALDSPGFTKRTFSFNRESFTNDTTLQPLYLLNDTLGTNVIINLKDTGLFPVSNHTIKIYRKLESGGRILVENDITDFVGQIAARLVENDVKYAFDFFDATNTLVKRIPNAIVTCTTTVCQQIFIIQELTGSFDDFDDISGYTSSLTFNNDTNTFNFVWVDNRGESQTHRLMIEKITFVNGTEVVFNGTSTSDSNVLSYTTDGSTASYRASAFRKVGTNERRIDVINTSVGGNSGTFSLEGLYWSFILFMVMLLVGRFYPPAGVILYLVGVFLLGILGIVFINPAIIIAEIVLGVLFIWSFKS